MKDEYTILFVDDYKTIRDFCKRELEKDGYRVFLANNGEEALTVMKQYPIDVVILDFRMPKMDGLETIKHIRRCDSKVRIIFYTAHREYIPADGRCVGADACIEKSEDLKELKSTIADLLGIKKRSNKLRV